MAQQLSQAEVRKLAKREIRATLQKIKDGEDLDELLEEMASDDEFDARYDQYIIRGWPSRQYG